MCFSGAVYLSEDVYKRQLLSQLGLLFSLVWLSVLSPADSILAMAAAAFCVSLFSATQDIVLDAFRVELFRTNQEGEINGATMYVPVSYTHLCLFGVARQFQQPFGNFYAVFYLPGNHIKVFFFFGFIIRGGIVFLENAVQNQIYGAEVVFHFMSQRCCQKAQ